MKEEMTNLEHELRESEAQAENSSLMSTTHRSQASAAYDVKFRKYQQFNSAVKSYKFKQVPNYDGDNAGTMKKVLWSPKIRMGYIVHLIFKFTFEMIFFYSVYWYQTRQTGVSENNLRMSRSNSDFRKKELQKCGTRPSTISAKSESDRRMIVMVKNLLTHVHR